MFGISLRDGFSPEQAALRPFDRVYTNEQSLCQKLDVGKVYLQTAPLRPTNAASEDKKGSGPIVFGTSIAVKAHGVELWRIRLSVASR